MDIGKWWDEMNVSEQANIALFLSCFLAWYCKQKPSKTTLPSGELLARFLKKDEHGK
jgi:hypothetical protein